MILLEDLTNPGPFPLTTDLGTLAVDQGLFDPSLDNNLGLQEDFSKPVDRKGAEVFFSISALSLDDRSESMRYDNILGFLGTTNSDLLGIWAYSVVVAR